MANPRQRRKARSSSHHPVSHSRNAKRNLKKTPTIRGPKVLQEAWDKRMTVKQNYAALGLLHTLNPLSSGGMEIRQDISIEPKSGLDQQCALPVHPGPDRHAVPKGFGRIIRDEAGNMVRIEVNEEPQSAVDERTQRMGMDPVIDANTLSKWSMNRCARSTNELEGPNSEVVEALQVGQLSAPPTTTTTLSFALSGFGSRHVSTGEVAYLQRLVNKYDDNIERMAQDRKLNPEQRTAGQLRAALRRAGLYGKR